MSVTESDNIFNHQNNDYASGQRPINGVVFSTHSDSPYNSMSRNHHYATSHQVGGRKDYTNKNLQYDYQHFAGTDRDSYQGELLDDGNLGERGGGTVQYRDSYRDYPPPYQSTNYDRQESGAHQHSYPHHPQKSHWGCENERPYYHRPDEFLRIENRKGYYRDDDDYHYPDDHVSYRHRKIHGNAPYHRTMNEHQGRPNCREKEAEERFYTSDRNNTKESFSYPTVRDILSVEDPIDSYEVEEYPKEGRVMYSLKQDDRFGGSNHVKQDMYRQYNHDPGTVQFKAVHSVMPGDAYSQSIARKLKEAEKASAGGAAVVGIERGGGGCTSLRKPTAQHSSRLEIAPNVYARLRTAQETMDAIERDFYIPTECFCCNITILCIQDADYVLCPECRVISRNGGGDFDEFGDGGIGGASGGKDGGVGLGFTLDELAEWQAEAVERSMASNNSSDNRYNRSYRY